MSALCCKAPRSSFTQIWIRRAVNIIDHRVSGESFFFFKHFTLCGLSMGIIHETKSDNAPSRAVSCISQAPISTACLIPPLPHLLICNLTAPPPPPLPPYGPNSGSLSSCSRGRQQNNPEGERG